MRAATISIAAMAAIASSANAHEGDIGLAVINGGIVTGIVEDGPSGEFVVPGQRVFAGEMFEFGGRIYADGPGLFAEAGVFPDSELNFDFASPVQRWSGSGFESAAQTFTLEYGPLSATSPVAGAGAGFGIGVGPAGFDEHYDFYLNDAETGVYLLALDFSSGDAGIGAALTTYIVLNNGVDERVHDAAIAYVEDVIVPAPGSLAVLGLGALAMRRRR